MALEPFIRDRLKDRPLLLMTHAVVGYPSLDANWQMLECMQKAGVDLVELQLPFSEPIADGPTFIKANQSALTTGLHWDDYFGLLARASREFTFSLLFMGYYNSVFRMGHAAFCDRLARAGAGGLIVADLPPEEACDLMQEAESRQLDFIRLMAPTNSSARLREIADGASGFVYCVARKGVTGRATELDESVVAYVKRCRAATRLPIALGFGIRSSEHMTRLRGIADIAIVGSACLEAWEQKGRDGYAALLKELAGATSRDDAL
ncbi:MAG: tryptophan synthase subunit alpha [Gammaproteobacteria bacterium]|nr:tryptophan synthase subunit alpha [Gammaproteobacteria bacterium]